MKILVVGSGGREHAICWAIKKSRHNPQIFCAPGNAGINEIAECIDIFPTEINRLAEFASANSIDLTIVGGETALAAGIVDEFESRNLKIAGASQNAARLEASKVFAKDFMTRHKIPTARFKTAKSVAEAMEILRSGIFGNESAPVVVKADGLAAGKGVVVAKNRKEAEQAVLEMADLVGTQAANKILLEETLTGREVSLLLFSDGKDFALMPPARDHKRIGEGDTGANTGGMGTITDKSLLDENQTREIVENIIKPTLSGATVEGFPFRGILFLGLMMTESGAQVLEYNVRFGDPETQSILIRLKSDLVEICQAIVEGKLRETTVEFSDKSSACIVLASRGYPAHNQTGDVIRGLEKVKNNKNAFVFHAGTARNENGDFVTSGGRVLGVTAIGRDLENALQNAYAAIGEISWNGMQYRRDIGK
ncbi:MAG: phosphoribosylamine--glycine ligase [Acidobacteriota bacterium]|nr:phosphoribosylamine--glycine ligase [Acidobacteriota bacterium]